MKIVVLDGFTLNPGDNSWKEMEQLGDLTVYDRTPANAIIERAAGAEIVLTNKTPLSAATLNQLTDLQFISVIATGFNVVDVDAARERRIPVANVPIYGTDTVAQHVFAVLLSFIYRPFAHDRAIRDGAWQQSGDFSFWLQPLTEMAGLTMGIVGYGRIGSRVAEIANAFGMNVLAHNPSPKPAPDFDGFQFVELRGLFAKSDVVSLHCPQTADNQEFVDRQLLAQMKPTAILINTARGGLINESDLADALNHNGLAGACLDVVSTEPIEPDNPLLHAKNCLLTPHYAWATLAARKRLMAETVNNVAAFLAGSPVHVVN